MPVATVLDGAEEHCRRRAPITSWQGHVSEKELPPLHAEAGHAVSVLRVLAGSIGAHRRSMLGWSSKPAALRAG